MWILSSVGLRLNLLTWKHWCYARAHLPLLSIHVASLASLLHILQVTEKYIKSLQRLRMFERRSLPLIVNMPSNRIWALVCAFFFLPLEEQSALLPPVSVMQTVWFVDFKCLTSTERQSWFFILTWELSMMSVSCPSPEFCSLSLNKVIFFLLLIPRKYYCMKMIFKNNT